jgi:hypothetical protein
MRDTRTIRPQLALEMTMRDVLDNMEELVSGYGFADLGGEFEILAIEAVEVPDAANRYPAPPVPRHLFSAQRFNLSAAQQIA